MAYELPSHPVILSIVNLTIDEREEKHKWLSTERIERLMAQWNC